MGNTKCLNCGATMSCGCQKRTASDGKSVCSSCAAAYEQSLKNKKADSVKPAQGGIQVTSITAQFPK